MRFSKEELDDFKRLGVLRCHFDGKFNDAELFMSYVIDPSERTKMLIDLNGGIHLEPSGAEMWKSLDACERIFDKCVFLGFMFDSFLRACEDLKSLDPWFVSKDFISNVWAGSIRGNWSIHFQHENGGKEPYRNRFRKFIRSLDDRGLNWTEKFLAPDGFWHDKKAYWTE